MFGIALRFSVSLPVMHFLCTNTSAYTPTWTPETPSVHRPSTLCWRKLYLKHQFHQQSAKIILADLCRKIYFLGSKWKNHVKYANMMFHSWYEDKYDTRVSLRDNSMSSPKKGETWIFIGRKRTVYIHVSPPTSHCIHVWKSIDHNVVAYCGIQCSYMNDFSICYLTRTFRRPPGVRKTSLA